MSAEHRPQQYYQQFGKEEGREQQQRGVDASFPLLSNLKVFIADARANWKGRPETFDPAWYLYSQLKSTLRQSVITHAASEETHELMSNVMSAYAILAYPHFRLDEDRQSVGTTLGVYAGRGVTLKLNGLPLLEAMAEATDIPYTPGQTQFALPSEVIERQFPSRIVSNE